jgi:fibronectin type 3 domain-containing protein
MQMRSPGATGAPRLNQQSNWLLFSPMWLVWMCFAIAGCGAPGEPTPPSPQIPEAITDLSAHQAGDAVQLSFGAPGKSTRGERLKEPPTMEVLRGGLKPDGMVDPKSFRVVDTIPGSLLASYQQKNKVVFKDAIAPDAIRADPGRSVVYEVRARVSDKKTSASSNDVKLNLYPVPEQVASINLTVTENGVQLKWPAPTRTSGGELLAKVFEYRVYRGELDPASAESAGKQARDAKWKVPQALIGKTQEPEYLDGSVEYGKTYGYVVKSAVSAGGNLVESGDSALAVVTPKDTFPPAPPQGLVAAVLPRENGTATVDLSWAIGTEPDLAGYRVYRSEQEGVRGQLLTPELLPTPAFRDTGLPGGKRYWYTVTAVDRAGNESAPGAQQLVETQQPSS